MTVSQAAVADRYLEQAVEFTAAMIRYRSYSGEEGPLAEFIAARMRSLGYDEVWTDRGGNVIGKIKGSGGGRSLMLNSHMDVVGEGAPERWPYPPFAGTVAGGSVWGRGASDTKGAMAVQVYAAAAVKAEGLLPRGDIYVTAVTHEEDCGLGADMLVEEVRTEYAVVGEATGCDLAYGHRGRLLFEFHVRGRSAHASAPEHGANPIRFLARLVQALDGFPLGRDETYGRSSLAPTVIRMDNPSTNVIPDRLVLALDYRNTPLDRPEEVQAKLEETVRRCLIPGMEATVERIKIPVTFYTGERAEGYGGAPAFGIDPGHTLVREARQALEAAFNRPVALKLWPFATDSGRLMAAGIPTVGFAPGDSKVLHTAEDRIAIAELREGLIGNLALIGCLCNHRA